jgi:hypothetical protein
MYKKAKQPNDLELCSGDIALTSSTLINGDITAEVARRQPDGSWLWVVDQFAIGKKGDSNYGG